MGTSYGTRYRLCMGVDGSASSATARGATGHTGATTAQLAGLSWRRKTAMWQRVLHSWGFASGLTHRLDGGCNYVSRNYASAASNYTTRIPLYWSGHRTDARTGA